MTDINPLDVALEHGVKKFHAGDLDGAQAQFISILNTDPKHPDALYFMGLLDHNAGRYEVAENRARDLLLVKQNDGKALNLMGTILMTQRKTEEALTYFERGLKHAKEDPVIKVNAAICHIGMGEPQKSIELCEDAIKLKEDYINAYNILGNAYLGTGDMQKAADTFSKALQVAPNFHDARFNLGVSLYELNRYDEASDCFDKFLEVQPNSPHALCRKADVLVVWNRLDEAGQLYENAIDANEQFAPAYVGRGKIFQRVKRFDDALSNFRKAIELDPSNIEALMNTGDTFKRMGNDEAAAAAFSDVLAIDPENAQARFHLASVKGDDAPAKPDGDYVKRLFDEFADTFDESLSSVDYDAPQQMIDLASQHIDAGTKYDIIDLGCGTGLSGEKFKPYAASLKGVDLSPRMLAAASQRGIYDELEERELLDSLVRHQADFDLAVCADTFPYLGDLEAIFLSVSSALKDQGLFIFSLEAHDGDEDYILGKTARYRHSRAYLESLAARRGFELLACNDTSYRKEGGTEVPGFIVVMKKA